LIIEKFKEETLYRAENFILSFITKTSFQTNLLHLPINI